MDKLDLKYKAELSELQDLLAKSEDFLTEHGAKLKDIITMNVAIEEIFVNVVSYAYEGMENLGVDVSLSIDDDNVFVVSFADRGMYFDPLDKSDPDVKASVEDRDIGGLGIYMVKKSMDECLYERNDDKNIFIIKKKIKL